MTSITEKLAHLHARLARLNYDIEQVATPGEADQKRREYVEADAERQKLLALVREQEEPV